MALVTKLFPSIALSFLMPLLEVLGGFTIASEGVWRSERGMETETPKSMPIACILACCMVILFAGLASAADPPAELRHLGFSTDEHNWTEHSFWMKLSNHNDKPEWIVLPWSGNHTLPEKTIFRNEGVVFDWPDEPLQMTIFDGKGGVVALGVSCGISFRAFYLPAKTVLEISDFHIGSKTGFSKVVVVEAKELLVNGKVPLEKWVPFEVGVFKEEMLPSGVGKKAKLESEKAAASRKEHPGKKAEYIEAKGIHRWTIKFQNKGEKP